MKDKKVSQFPVLTTPLLSGVTVVVQNNVTYQSSIESLKTLILDGIPTGTTTGSTGTTVSVVDITYSALYDLYTGNTLVPETTYRVTDFQTIHYMTSLGNVLTDTFLSPIINTGSTEHLLIKAISIDGFYPEVYSEEYPNDIISYDIVPSNWIQDVSFSLDHVNIIPGFKGVIYKRHDTINQNILGYDFRTVKFRRWKKSDPLWDNNVASEPGDLVRYYHPTPGIEESGIYVAVMNTFRQNPTNRNSWVHIIDYMTNGNEYFEYNPNNALDINDYIDCLTFVETSGSTYSTSVNNNIFTPFKDGYDIGWGVTFTILCNNVFYLNNDSGHIIFNNTFGPLFENNTSQGYFYSNKFGYLMSGNIFGDSFNSSVFGDENIENIFNSGCSNIIFESKNINNLFGFNCTKYYLKNNNTNNIFNEANDMCFGNNNDNITLHTSTNGITLGNDNSYVFFGNGPSVNTGLGNDNNTLGDKNSNITFSGSGNVNNRFGSNNSTISLNIDNTNNTFGTSNVGITIAEDSSYNTFIGPTTSFNLPAETIKNVFYDCDGTSLDLSSATLIKQNYTCEIITNSNGTVRLKYIDGSDVLTITNVQT